MAARVVLILADPGDVSSDVVGAGLAARACPVRRVGVAELARARWHHAPEGGGTALTLPDGVCLDDDRIGVVLNRLDRIDLPRFAAAPADDRDYAAAEFTALLTSWLGGLAVPVANPPGDDDPVGASRHPLGWRVLARDHGLTVGDFVVASSVRGGACAGLERLGDSGFPRGSDVAGWYRPRGGSARRHVWIFGEACLGVADPVLAARCVGFVAALGLRYAALGFEGEALADVLPRPPLDDPAVAAACVDWLEAAR